MITNGDVRRAMEGLADSEPFGLLERRSAHAEDLSIHLLAATRHEGRAVIVARIDSLGVDPWDDDHKQGDQGDPAPFGWS